MKIKISREIKVGFLFIVALAVLIWGVMYLKGLDLFKPMTTIYAKYDRVNGLVSSNRVTINGLQVGQVSSIYFSKTEKGKIIVELMITEDYPIPRNSVARIYNSSLIGSKEIEIILGDGKDIIREGDTIPSSVDAPLGEEVSRQLLPIKEKAESLLGTIDTVAIAIKNILNESAQRDLRNALTQISVTSQNLANITHKVDTLIGSQKSRLTRIIGNVESISSNLKQNNERISTILENFSTVSDSLAKINISGTFNHVNSSLSDLNAILKKVNTGEGNIGLLLNDDKLYNELTKAARDLNLLISDIQANPSKYIKVSVF